MYVIMRYILGGDFLTNIKKLGGIPKVLLEDKCLLYFFITIMKNDLNMLYEFLLNIDFKSINTDINVFLGNEDNIIDKSSENCWARYTTKNYILKSLNDGHFIGQTSEIEIFQ